MTFFLQHQTFAICRPKERPRDSGKWERRILVPPVKITLESQNRVFSGLKEALCLVIDCTARFTSAEPLPIQIVQTTCNTTLPNYTMLMSPSTSLHLNASIIESPSASLPRFLPLHLRFQLHTFERWHTYFCSATSVWSSPADRAEALVAQMSSVMPVSPAGGTPSAIQDPSPAYSISTATVEFRSLHTDNYEPASTFFALVDTIDDLADENEEPPFVHRRSTTPDNAVFPLQPVKVDVDAVQQLFNVSEQDEIAEALELYQYDTKLLFWVLTAGPLKIIVGNDSGDGMYQAWLGPEVGFSTVTLAYDQGGSDASSTGYSTAHEMSNFSEDGEQTPANTTSNTNHTATQDKLGIVIRKFGTEINERAASFYQLPATMNASLDPTLKLECIGHKHSLIMFYPQGRMIVKPDLDEIKKLFHVSPDQIASELILYEYGEKYAFWTMRIGGETVIMKGKGGRFSAWLGPTRQLSGPLATSKGLNPRVTPQSGRKSNAAQIAEDQGGEGIGSRHDGARGKIQIVLDMKITDQVLEHELSASWLQKKRAVDLEGDDDSDSDVTTVHRYPTRKRMKLFNDSQTIVSYSARGLSTGGSTVEDVDGEDSMEEKSASDGSIQEDSTQEGSTREGLTSDGSLPDAPTVDGSMASSLIIEGVIANDMVDAVSTDDDSTEKHWNAGRSTAEAPTIDVGRLDKLARTKLYVSISTNNYGAVPIKMSSCRTIDAFFASVLAAWDLEEREDDVAAVVVRVDRDGARGQPIVVKRKVTDSFDEMLEMIEGASCWNGGGKQSCKVDVEIKIVQA
jgi:hypothetical protein